ncbi:MAG: quinone-dependent dihydroorotate dehydrogenase [Gammaproteobacteria bacterium]|nr:quinone-dependent dihydroorotate dehydrogenase [Gammaproteobacteria bacterium]
MSIYELLRPILFSLPPEWAHQLTLNALRWYGYLPAKRNTFSNTIEVGGLHVTNRVGLAAGFDKDGVAIRGLSKFNFGFLELGAVTPRAQAGNSRPRVFRLKKEFALINRLGFNNQGIDALIRKIVNEKPRVSVPIGVNIGKNFDTPLEQAIDDYEYCFVRAHTLVDFVTINISSPNTPGLRELQGMQQVQSLLARLVRLRESSRTTNGKRTLLLVKISPDLAERELENLCAVVRAEGIDGMVASNTTTTRPTKDGGQYQGGLSGRPLFPLALKCVRQARSFLGAKFLIIGCGGIWDPSTAKQMREAGADLIQIYTGLVYHGPRCLREISQVA